MNTKTLTSWLLIVGPILMFGMFAFLWPALIGEGETAASDVAELMDNPQLSLIMTAIGTLIFVGTISGLALLSWSKAPESGAVGALGSLSSIVFVGVAAVGIAAMGSNFGVIEEGAENVAGAEMISQVAGWGLFNGLFWFWSIGNILLGATLVVEKKLNNIVSWLFLLVGVLMVLTQIVEADLGDIVEIVIWISMTLVTVAVGYFNLKSDS